MERTAELPKVNRERKKRRKETGQVYGSFYRWTKGRPCILAGHAGHDCRGAIDGHHVKSVGAGGKDAENITPMCRAAHAEVHSLGCLSFEAKFGVDLDLEAGAVWGRYCDVTPPDSEGEDD